MWEMFPDVVGTEIYDKYHEAMREQRTVRFETHFRPTDEWIEAQAYPTGTGLSIYYRNVTDRKRAREELERRASQQAAVTELGLRALAHADLESLMEEAVQLVARTVDVELVQIAESVPDDEEVLIRSGVGWRSGVVGSQTEPAGAGSQPGYALLSREPVVIEDLATEERFKPSVLATEHGAVSAMTVVIESTDEPFGILAALSRRARWFMGHEVNFLQAVANVISTAVERVESENRLLQVRETERRRIARDLYDEALQPLTDALALAIGADRRATDSEESERLARLASALKSAGQQLRGAIYDLRLGGEEERPFANLLEDLVDLQREMAVGCQIDVEVRDRIPAGSLGRRGTEAIRVVREALINARRHSGSRNIRVAVWGSDRELSVEVSDEGRGFDATVEPSDGGTGIRGMRERAALLGAELDIRSEAGTGTRVRFKLPLGEDHEASRGEVRVLLVEDHAAVREAIAAMFERESDFDVVGQAASLAEARELLHDVDVAVVDLGLPDGYGGDLIKELREANPEAQALVLSASLDRADIARAIESGAAATLDKSVHLEEVVDAVRRLRAGETLLPMGEVVELLRFAGRQRERERDDRLTIERLTAREREVLQGLADGLDSQAISDRLHITIRTERNHIANILAKLGLHSRLQAVVFALRYAVVEIR